MSAEKFLALIRSASEQMETDYERAREHARSGDPQRAGHEGEAAWQTFIKKWFPVGQIVTRKYLVGPEGSTNEIDLVVLKPDYPTDLANESSVLVSGVAAAFSCKLTLKRPDIEEALKQKRRLNQVAGDYSGSWPSVMTGPVPFGLLSQSTSIAPGSADFVEHLSDVYDSAAHPADGSGIQHPSEELDCVLIADRGFWNTSYSAFSPVFLTNEEVTWKPMTAFMSHGEGNGYPGYPLVQFLAWLASRCGEESSSLSSLTSVFGPPTASGRMVNWDDSIYPEHIRDNRRYLVGDFGNYKIVL